MPEPKDARALAEATIVDTAKIIAECDGISLVDIQAVHATLQSASAIALLYVGDQIREQVEVLRQQLEQQRLANVIAAFQAGIGREDNWLEMGYDDTAAAASYVRAQIGDIANPLPESETHL